MSDDRRAIVALLIVIAIAAFLVVLGDIEISLRVLAGR